MMVIIDATDLVLGRLAAHAAKQALLGEKVDIVNCEKAIITGSKRDVIGRYKKKHDRGSTRKGPFMDRQPDRFVKRTIRGMLPYKQEKGKLAFNRIKCYNGLPKDLEGKEMMSIDEAHAKNISTDFGSVGTVCRELGGKW